MDIQKLYQTKKTVFTTPEIGQIFQIVNPQTLRKKLSRRWKQWILIHLHYGVWAFADYTKEEVANVLKIPSYISLETVLYKDGVIFQYYGNTILSISDNTKSFKIQETNYEYHKIHPKFLLNPKWINYINNINIASVERAICDRLYLTPWYYFDNLRNIDWDKIFDIAEMYQNKRLILDLKNLQNVTKY